MTLHFRTVQLGSERFAGEGLRIGAVRYLPRGVPKSEYGARNYFDVWLPILAPSRELLQSARSRRLTTPAFFRRYRREMQSTDARQVVLTLSRLAVTTPISVGCYCQEWRSCHRSVLGDLIRQAAGFPATRPLADRAIYTIKSHEDLQDVEQSGAGAGAFEERKPWTTAAEWLREAQSLGERLPVLFADATDCSRLTHWAQLDGILLSLEGTVYSFSKLEPIRSNRSPQELRLFHADEPISEGFIRPYALVRTPAFLRDGTTAP